MSAPRSGASASFAGFHMPRRSGCVRVARVDEGPGNALNPGIYLCPTPIGNLDDITLRTLQVLRDADVLVAEDTRRTRQLLTRHGITRRLRSLRQENEAGFGPRLVAQVQGGKSVAVVSDAGMPAVSDPGGHLVRLAVDAGVAVTALPGPSALPAALAGSGLPTAPCYFGGFLPKRTSDRRRLLAELTPLAATLVFFEAPHRILGSLTDLAALWPERPACLVRELSKLHEEWLRGSLASIRDALGSRDQVRGEITLVVHGGDGTSLPPAAVPANAPLPRRARALAQSAGISRREAYRLLAGEPSKNPPGH